MEFELKKSDIKKIGNTATPDRNGNTSIICNGMTANIEELFLRNILKLFGEYVIVDAVDFVWNNNPDEVDIEFQTNLPWDVYLSIQDTEGV